MILAIDIGNTDIAIGGYEEERLLFVARVSSDVSKTDYEYESIISRLLENEGVERENVSGAIISSVVPLLSSLIYDLMKKLYSVDAICVSSKINLGIDIICDDPSTVGADLICACVGVYGKYGAPAIIIDMGTATKIIAINSDGAFIGVSIMPGVMMGMRSLSSGTAQLPQFGLDAPSKVIGTNTLDCMKSGAIFGNASMIDGMIERFCEEYGRELPVIATGGYSHAIIPYCKHNIIHDESIVLDGLNIIYGINN